MVLFRKSPVEPHMPVMLPQNHMDVWVMEATGEVFEKYESYLQKLDYYRRKLFSCEITGHRNLTFFEALKSEKSGMREIDSLFPFSLREPLLRKVQFSTISRTDELVNYLYDTFKEDFYPGEHVSIDDPGTGNRVSGRITEKQQVLTPMMVIQDGVSQYMVHVPEPSGVPPEPDRQHKVAHHEVYRDRRSFTKQVLRSFLKHTITRERFDGAPWQVKEEMAKRYKIDSKIPRHLTMDAILTQRKVLKRSKANTESRKPATQAELKELSYQIKHHKGNLPAALTERFHEVLDSLNDPLNGPLPVARKSGKGGKTSNLLKNGNLDPPARAKPREKPREKTPPPPPPKYPIEDLEVQPKRDAAFRPHLNRLHDAIQSFVYSESSQAREDIDVESVGTLLEIWNTLNVHGSYFVLDSFTFDDFVDAMLFSSEDVACELFSEIHCAVLKTLVNSKGEAEANIPALSSSNESSSVESSIASTPVPEEAMPNTRRKSKRMTEANLELSQMSDGKKNDDNLDIGHSARDLLQDYDWMDRIKDRDFGRGGWQTIMVGLLEHMLLSDDEGNTTYVKILSHLAPEDQKPTRETVRRQYSKLDVNLRVSALETAVMLTVTSKSFKDAMESRSEQQTIDRKEKVDAQRRKKPLILELQELDTQRKLQRPEPAQENSELSDSALNAGTSMVVDNDAAVTKANGDTDADSEDELPQRFRSLRRTSGRTNELKRKREEEDRLEKEKKARLEEASLTTEERQYRKILKDIEKKKEEIKECEDEVAEVEEKLRENACHRTKSLGKDRFFNRYWWFERNGMRYGGQETSSTAHYGYANGRLWVQGPDDLEFDGLFESTEQEPKQSRQQIGMTVKERRKKEEGDSSLLSAREWGFYGTASELDELMAWLDDRGNREKELLKELQTWRDKIAECMDAMNAHVQEVEEKKIELVEPAIGIATRKKAHVDNNPTKFPCLAWTNTLALQEFGQLHADGPLPKKMRGAAKSKDKAVPLAKRQTRRGTKF